ncbi:hypothetical protein MTO96_049925 [Rhipicephalus appendiculatus]
MVAEGFRVNQEQVTVEAVGPPVLKPKSPVPTAKRAPNYWENKGVEQSDDMQATMTSPAAIESASENEEEASNAGTEGDLTASSELEPSTTDTSRDSWNVPHSENEEQEVPEATGHPDGDAPALPRVDDANFPPLPTGNSRPPNHEEVPIVSCGRYVIPDHEYGLPGQGPIVASRPPRSSKTDNAGADTSETQARLEHRDRSRSRSPRESEDRHDDAGKSRKPSPENKLRRPKGKGAQ